MKAPRKDFLRQVDEGYPALIRGYQPDTTPYSQEGSDYLRSELAKRAGSWPIIVETPEKRLANLEPQFDAVCREVINQANDLGVLMAKAYEARCAAGFYRLLSVVLAAAVTVLAVLEAWR